MEYQRGLACMVFNFFDRKTTGNGATKLANKSAIKYAPQNEQLLKNEPIIKKLKKKKCIQHTRMDADAGNSHLADMQLISKCSKGFRFLLCLIDIYSKYAWVVPLKDKTAVSIVNAFQKILKESARKPHKIWVVKGFEFYKSSFKKWLKDNSIEVHSTHNIDNSVVAEQFIRPIKNKIYKYMTSISKNVYIDKLDDIVNECNNTYHRISITMKLIDVRDNTYIDFGKEVNDNDPKFKFGDHVRMSKYKIIFAKG